MDLPSGGGAIVPIPGAAPIGSACVSVESGAVESRCACASTPAPVGKILARRSATAELIAPFRAVPDGDSSFTVASAVATSRWTRTGSSSFVQKRSYCAAYVPVHERGYRSVEAHPRYLGEFRSQELLDPGLYARLDGVDHSLYEVLRTYQRGRRNVRCGRSRAARSRWRT